MENLIAMLRELDLEKNSKEQIRYVLNFIADELEKGLSIEEKQLQLLGNYFNIDNSNYEDGKYLELEAWTNGGVDMIIEIDLQKNDIITELENYIENFDIDEEIDLYRQDKNYKANFTITESVKDFEGWIEWIKQIIELLKQIR